MKRIFMIFLALLVSGLIIVSCQKPPEEPQNSQNTLFENVENPFLTAEQKAIVIDRLSAVMNGENAGREIGFIPPLFVFDNVAVLTILNEDFSKNATFTILLDDNDFFTDNPDGTMTIHINTNNATSELADLLTLDYYIGQKGHAMLNYTGYVEVIPLDEYLPYFLYMFMPDEYTQPAVWHGNGKVQLDGVGKKKNLVAHLSASEGWTNVNNFIRLN